MRATDVRNLSIDALRAELDYITRSLAWTFSRAGREGTSVDLNSLTNITDRADALRKGIQLRSRPDLKINYDRT